MHRQPLWDMDTSLDWLVSADWRSACLKSKAVIGWLQQIVSGLRFTVKRRGRVRYRERLRHLPDRDQQQLLCLYCAGTFVCHRSSSSLRCGVSARSFLVFSVLTVHWRPGSGSSLPLCFHVSFSQNPVRSRLVVWSSASRGVAAALATRRTCIWDL